MILSGVRVAHPTLWKGIFHLLRAPPIFVLPTNNRRITWGGAVASLRGFWRDDGAVGFLAMALRLPLRKVKI